MWYKIVLEATRRMAAGGGPIRKRHWFSDSVESSEFLEQLSNCQLFKTYSVSRSNFVKNSP
jgi:hypothetical protein